MFYSENIVLDTDAPFFPLYLCRTIGTGKECFFCWKTPLLVPGVRTFSNASFYIGQSFHELRLNNSFDRRISEDSDSVFHNYFNLQQKNGLLPLLKAGSSGISKYSDILKLFFKTIPRTQIFFDIFLIMCSHEDLR